MKDSLSSNPIQESLRLMNRCPVCQKEYQPNEANVLEQKKGAHLVHLTCPSCKSAIMAVVLVSSLGTSTVGMLTDLNVKDVERLKNKGSISEDELLNFYSFISRHPSRDGEKSFEEYFNCIS